MQQLNPEWHLDKKTNCAEQLQLEIDRAPLDKDTFLRQRQHITFKLPLRWDDVTDVARSPCSTRYRGYEAEHPDAPVDDGASGLNPQD